jgi:hypothetical protein
MSAAKCKVEADIAFMAWAVEATFGKQPSTRFQPGLLQAFLAGYEAGRRPRKLAKRRGRWCRARG